MSKNPYKHHKRQGGAFVALPHWLMKSDAWRSLTPTSRALYVELKFYFNGLNNGKIFLSHRQAAGSLNISRPTVAKAFDELKSKGFIVATREHCLGTEGIGQSSHYAITEESLNGKPATKDFMKRATEKQ